MGSIYLTGCDRMFMRFIVHGILMLKKIKAKEADLYLSLKRHLHVHKQ
ncbi:hypothetical protein M1N12_02530 [Peptococcaceae bacterium]|nr:hypothetical protein [Peptococcaceae bacterium]